MPLHGRERSRPCAFAPIKRGRGAGAKHPLYDPNTHPFANPGDVGGASGIIRGVNKRQITLYTRPGCHLCEDAADLLEQLARQVVLEVAEVNILGDIDLYERYKHSIPVIAIAGGATLFAPIRADALARALADGVESEHA